MTGQIKRNATIKIMIFLFIFLTGATAWAQEAPQTFDIREDTGFYYTIKKGDTLWDLSQKFYNSQWDWPGLWEMNKKIKNPHWIYPGNRIRVYLKPQYRRPSAQTVEAAAQTPTAAPPSPVAPEFNYPPMDHVGFIKKRSVPAVGSIIREEEGNIMMSSDDIIYIKPLTRLEAGKTYRIFNTEPVSQKIKGRVYKGVKHLIKGKAEILEINDRYAKAKITASNRYATIGDKLMPAYEGDTVLTVDDQPAPIDAAIICSENNDRMINDYKIAFINKGSNDNLSPGQIYSVLQRQQNLSVHDVAAVSLLDPLDTGRLIVLHTELDTATVMILSSNREILPGDLVR